MKLAHAQSRITEQICWALWMLCLDFFPLFVSFFLLISTFAFALPKGKFSLLLREVGRAASGFHDSDNTT